VCVYTYADSDWFGKNGSFENLLQIAYHSIYMHVLNVDLSNMYMYS